MNILFYKKIFPLIIFSICPDILFSQLCTGSLGDPVVNITFDNKGTVNTAFPPPAGYTYTASTCPGDGYYTITSYTSGCFGSNWHTVTGDHTGGGDFMLVNASYQPADFFVTTVNNLCPNTSYQFSAWIMNVLQPAAAGIKPNVTFHIETVTGVNIDSFNTGDIQESPQPTWLQYGFLFTTTPNDTAIVLRITNNAPGGNGNDLALDDISFSPCGPLVTSTIGNILTNMDVCINEQIPLRLNGSITAGFSNPVFQWQQSIDSGKTWIDLSGADGSSYTRKVSGSGQFWYRLTVAEGNVFGIKSCRVASNILMINIHPLPYVDAGPDRVLIKNDSLVIRGNASGESISYLWVPSIFLNSDTLLQPLAFPPQDMDYSLSVTSAFGCSNAGRMHITVVNDIFIPTAFTPNNDGKNDHWRIPYLDPGLDASVMVYNRFGQLVYHVKGKAVNWDGNFKQVPQPAGVYVYHIHFGPWKKDMQGTILLVR
jgi:gliding motility-associated-like protein